VVLYEMWRNPIMGHMEVTLWQLFLDQEKSKINNTYRNW
jgi:hypothetical protein